MVEFWVYDVTFMVLFTIFVAWFLSTRKKDLSREGIIFMYRTQAGVKFIKYVGDTYKKTLDALKIPIIGVGLLLMAGMIWMLGQTIWIYVKFPQITDIVKAPPIAPLIPYFPKLFGMESFFPPFYFTYFIVALAIVAVVHEFSHGIFMRRFGVKIKSTGLVFLGPILGAFVEEEQSSFQKKNNLNQMTILGAGVFANLLFAFIFYLLYVAFFLSSFAAGGYIFTSYSYGLSSVDSIDSFGEDLGEISVVINGGAALMNLSEVVIDGKDYYINTNTKEIILTSTNLSEGQILIFPKDPAIESGLKGVIRSVDGETVGDHSDLRRILGERNPGETVLIETRDLEGDKTFELTLGEHPSPERAGDSYIGVAHQDPQRRGFVQRFLGGFMSFKESSTYYEATWDGNFVKFVIDLLWWVMVINLLVALFNMMPLGMLDGGRFFYLAVLSVTKNEKFAAMSFKAATWAIGFVFAFLMFIWAIRVF